MLMAMTSCNHKDLCYEHSHGTKLRVVYDWTEAPDATCKGMCVFFYSTDHPGAYYRFDFANTEGGEIELPEGNYEVITYNNDTEIVRFSATNIFESHKAYTRNGDLLEPLYGNGVTSNATTDNGERVVVTPDGLWGCHATEVSVSEHGVTYTFTHFDDRYSSRSEASTTTEASGDQIITLYPHDMLCHYSYEVRNVDNAGHISRVSGALSGMAPSMNLADESLDTEKVTLPVPGKADGNTKKITGEFLTFGHNPSNSASHKMSFFVVMDDGSKYSVKDSPNLDVTQQVDTAHNRRRVHIIIDGLKLPRPLGDDGGFNPTVDDWGVKEEDLPV